MPHKVYANICDKACVFANTQKYGFLVACLRKSSWESYVLQNVPAIKLARHFGLTTFASAYMRLYQKVYVEPGA
jgi:hypothetical protein